MAPASPSQQVSGFQKAFEQLLSLAPGPVFPRARRLYFNKYPLEGRPPEQPAAGASPPRFLTFLLEEQIEESEAGLLQVRALSFALVHWQAPHADPADYAAYLQEQWHLPALDLRPMREPWFREGGAYARFQAEAIYERTPAAMGVAVGVADGVADSLLRLDQPPSS
ncbi:MAG: hypothetical protein R6W06_09585 [Prochlorococcaceae cyanobacterium]